MKLLALSTILLFQQVAFAEECYNQTQEGTELRVTFDKAKCDHLNPWVGAPLRPSAKLLNQVCRDLTRDGSAKAQSITKIKNPYSYRTNGYTLRGGRSGDSLRYIIGERTYGDKPMGKIASSFSCVKQ